MAQFVQGSEMISSHCSQLIAEASSLHPLYGDRLANHLPMALIALERMGATPARLERFAASYSRRLVRRGESMPALDPIVSLGDRNSFEGVHAYFADEVRRFGADSILRQWLPLLMPGVAASAFHALIRLAYGIDASDDSEIVSGLAYWVVEHQPLSTSAAVTRTDRTLADIAASAHGAVEGLEFEPGIIVDRMAQIARLPAMRAMTIQPTTLDYRQIADFAIGVYAARADFTLLHLVTACHAFRTTVPFLQDPIDGTRYLWEAVLIAYLSTGLACKPLLSVPNDAGWSWPKCLEAAIESDNDHVIKLTYTAWKESSLNDDPRYLYSAWRDVSRAPS